MTRRVGKLPRSVRGPKAPLLFIEWVDSCRTRGWVSPLDIPPTAKTCFTVGWLLHEDGRVVSVAASAGLDDKTDGFDSVDGHMTIPKVAIIRRRVLSAGRL